MQVFVKVQPGAKSDRLVGQREGRWVIAIAAPAIEGKANRALERYLAKQLGVPKSHVQVEKGQASRLKVVTILGVSEDQVHQRLNALSASS